MLHVHYFAKILSYAEFYKLFVPYHNNEPFFLLFLPSYSSDKSTTLSTLKIVLDVKQLTNKSYKLSIKSTCLQICFVPSYKLFCC